MAQEFTKRFIDALHPAPKDQLFWDEKITGFGLKLTPAGKKIFLLSYRFPGGRQGKQRRIGIGTYGDITLQQAREIAQAHRGEIAKGIDPMAVLIEQRLAAEAEKRAPTRTVRHIIKEFVENYAKKQNRSWQETERILKRDVEPVWGGRIINEIKRSDVASLLDRIEEKAGAPMANAVLAQIRKMFNWHAVRDETFISPIVKGMARKSPQSMKRDRILSDDEIRILWMALEDSQTPFRQLVRFLLLTAQRRDEAAKASKDEISGEIWTIPAERYKTKKPNIVPLSPLAMAQLNDLGEHRELGNFIFTTTGNKPFSGFSKAKRRLDTRMAEILNGASVERDKPKVIKPWRLHDLRRTAKTLMQRVGVPPNISERVLGHVIPGVEGTYDHHNYLHQKRDALDKLEHEILKIIGSDLTVPKT